MISPLKKRPRLTTVALALAVSSAAQAQNQPGPSAAELIAVDSRISAALQQVSAERIRANIEKLASFGTRLTISGQDPAAIATGRGIGAGVDQVRGICAAATILLSISRDLPRYASRSFAKIFIISIRTCARRTVLNMAT